MPIPISPMPLSLGERMQLRLLRGGMRTARAWMRLRGLPPGLQAGRFRYGTHPLETGDLIEGTATRESERAPVVYVHGGGWICGHREPYARELAFLVEAGHPVANLDYPLAPEHPHPAPLISLLHALAWLRTEDPRYARVHLMGDSAGGNLVAMLALWLADARHAAAWQSEMPPPGACPHVASVVSLYGVLDRHSWLEHGFPFAKVMMRAYGGAAGFEPEVDANLAFTPVDLEIGRGAPPVFVAYGEADPLAESSRLGAAHLDAAGVETRVACYPDQPHGFFNMSKRPESQALRHDVLGFLEDVEKRASSGASAAD